MKILIDHIGWITNDPNKFEAFWVDILGFNKIWESWLTPQLARTLFGVKCGAKCLRYQKDDIVIEIHQFNRKVKEHANHFVRFGLNHVALFVPSRKEFLAQYKFETHIFHNPKGWDNIFIRDFEGNWIELKEKL